MKWFTPRVVVGIAVITLALAIETSWEQYPTLAEKIMGAMAFNVGVAIIAVLLLKALYVSGVRVVESIR